MLSAVARTRLISALPIVGPAMAATSAKSTLWRAATRTSSHMVFDDFIQESLAALRGSACGAGRAVANLPRDASSTADRLRHDAERERRRLLVGRITLSEAYERVRAKE